MQNPEMCWEKVLYYIRNIPYILFRIYPYVNSSVKLRFLIVVFLLMPPDKWNINRRQLLFSIIYAVSEKFWKNLFQKFPRKRIRKNSNNCTPNMCSSDKTSNSAGPVDTRHTLTRNFVRVLSKLLVSKGLSWFLRIYLTDLHDLV